MTLRSALSVRGKCAARPPSAGNEWNRVFSGRRRPGCTGRRGYAVWLGAIVLAGCTPGVITPNVADRSTVPTKLDWTDWGVTLSRAVQGERVDYATLMKDSAPLDRFLAMAAQVGPAKTPDQFPDRDGRLAYYINCYNASIVRSILALGRHGRIPAVAPFDLETRYRFEIDGRWRTPRDLRRRVMDLAGDDWRIRFALCNGRVTGPPLAPRPFIGGLLDGQLDHVTRMALYSPGVIRIDHGGFKQLVLWSGLYELRERLIRDYETRMGTSNATILNALGQWSNRKRRITLNSAVGYDVVPMPNDATINQVEPPPVEGSGISWF